MATLHEAKPRIMRGRYEIVEYGSFTEFMQDATRRSGVTERAANSRYWIDGDGYNNNANWFGLTRREKEMGFDAIASFLQTGWHDGLRKLEDTIGKLPFGHGQAASLRRVTVRGSEGDEYDIHRAYAGDFGRAWGKKKRRMSENRITQITIISDSIVNGGMDSDSLFWRGAAAVRLADLLIDAGYDVALKMGFCCLFRDGYFGTLVTVKDFGQQLDLSAAAACCHPATFRMFGHHWLVTESKNGHYEGGVNVESLPEFENDFLSQANTQDQAEDWIKASIERIESGSLQLLEVA